jgi:hypothetical protein
MVFVSAGDDDLRPSGGKSSLAAERSLGSSALALADFPAIQDQLGNGFHLCAATLDRRIVSCCVPYEVRSNT